MVPLAAIALAARLVSVKVADSGRWRRSARTTGAGTRSRSVRAWSARSVARFGSSFDVRLRRFPSRSVILPLNVTRAARSAGRAEGKRAKRHPIALTAPMASVPPAIAGQHPGAPQLQLAADAGDRLRGVGGAGAALVGAGAGGDGVGAGAAGAGFAIV